MPSPDILPVVPNLLYASPFVSKTRLHPSSLFIARSAPQGDYSGPFETVSTVGMHSNSSSSIWGSIHSDSSGRTGPAMGGMSKVVCPFRPGATSTFRDMRHKSPHVDTMVSKNYTTMTGSAAIALEFSRGRPPIVGCGLPSNLFCHHRVRFVPRDGQANPPSSYTKPSFAINGAPRVYSSTSRFARWLPQNYSLNCTHRHSNSRTSQALQIARRMHGTAIFWLGHRRSPLGVSPDNGTTIVTLGAHLVMVPCQLGRAALIPLDYLLRWDIEDLCDGTKSASDDSAAMDLFGPCAATTWRSERKISASQSDCRTARD